MTFSFPRKNNASKKAPTTDQGKVLFSKKLFDKLNMLRVFRARYIFTPAHTLRLRYTASFAFVILLTAVFSAYQFIQFPEIDNKRAQSLVLAQNHQTQQEKIPLTRSSTDKENIVVKTAQNRSSPLLPLPRETEEVSAETVTLSSFFKSAPIEENPANIQIGKGQTVAGQLAEFGVPSAEAHGVVQALSEYYDLKKVRPGQSFEVEYEHKNQADGRILKSVSKMTMPVTPAKQIVVYRQNETFKAREIEKKLETEVIANKAEIKYSLYGSASKAGIPDEIIAKMIRIFSWSIDFQRDIRSGDQIEVLYETKQTEAGIVMGFGDILYARIVSGGRDLSLYRHKTQEGHVNYFDHEGNSIKRTLIQTPVDGARMSSGYGMRRHPVLGYNKMHKGVDFAAPTGTPIYAAGDGIVELAGRRGSFGNYVRIRHNSNLKTAYAHMHRIKSGIRPGARVKQGQVIGTVGSTGRSTGPHLHYEVHINGEQVNPRGVNVPVGESLKGRELKTFNANKDRLDGKFAALTAIEKYAEAKPERVKNVRSN